ncbi:MAG TPA: hypothetical protein VKQ36_12760 [Ktedonobacterales bacterium]|nr:hypothetical protein [Ktedonobacterales bacterium]
MSVRTLRWSGWLLLFGSFAFIAGSLPGLFGDTSQAVTIALLVVMIAGALVALVGLPAIYAKQAKQVGWLGLVSFLAALLASVMLGIVANVYFLVTPAATSGSGSAQPSPLLLLGVLGGSVLELIGGVIFGILTIRAHVFPAVTGWILILAGILSLAFFTPGLNDIGGTIAEMALFLAFGWMGYHLAFRSAPSAALSPV